MTDRKKNREKEFCHDPFKRLKGFCVQETEKEQPAGKPAPEPQAASPVPDEADLFAEEMERLGVASKNGSSAAPADEPPEAPGEPPAAAAAVPPPTEREIFLSSLGEMEAVFVDEIPEPEELPAVPRRMRQLRRGGLAPEAQLDLHGLARDAARDRVRYFLENAVYHGMKTVLIVTGRGKGSGGEPVLRIEIERYLAHEAGVWVAEWGRAPARYGGEGALVVFLKGRKVSR